MSFALSAPRIRISDEDYELTLRTGVKREKCIGASCCRRQVRKCICMHLFPGSCWACACRAHESEKPLWPAAEHACIQPSRPPPAGYADRPATTVGACTQHDTAPASASSPVATVQSRGSRVRTRMQRSLHFPTSYTQNRHGNVAETTSRMTVVLRLHLYMTTLVNIASS